MEIKLHGGSTFSIKVNKQTFVFDPAVKSMGVKNPKLKDNVVLITNDYETLSIDDIKSQDPEFIIESPGEYEIHDVAIFGIETPASLDVHDDNPDDKVTNTAYSFRAAGLTVGVLGHPAPRLTESIYERLGNIDVLVCPIGGGGMTLDATTAAKITKDIDPSAVIPVHYSQSGVSYEVDQADIDSFVSELGVPHRKEDKFKFKSGDLSETLEVIELNL